MHMERARASLLYVHKSRIRVGLTSGTDIVSARNRSVNFAARRLSSSFVRTYVHIHA
jgi:hypothetical protein